MIMSLSIKKQAAPGTVAGDVVDDTSNLKTIPVRDRGGHEGHRRTNMTNTFPIHLTFGAF